MKKARVSKSWSKHNLPEELWPEILSRLPVKSLLRFRCLCRSWKLFIDDPDFARLHFNNFNKCHQSNLFFVQSASSWKSRQCVVKNQKTLRTNFTIGFLESDLDSVHVLRTTPACSQVSRWSIVSSIDGLFMLQSKWNVFMLWNPSIRKTLTVPPSPCVSSDHVVDFGLGFDPFIKDYKFVRFVLKWNQGVQFVAVYTLGTNSWKAIEFQGERQYLFNGHEKRPIPCNGVVYALAKDKWSGPWDLVSFDLKSELFASFELPVNDEPIYHRALTLVDDGSSLALVCLSKSKGSIWMLEKLGDDIKSWSWIQRCIFPTSYSYDPWEIKFLWLKKNGEMLLKCGFMVMCYNLETHQQKMMMEKNKKYFQVENTVQYMESLILHHY